MQQEQIAVNFHDVMHLWNVNALLLLQFVIMHYHYETFVYYRYDNVGRYFIKCYNMHTPFTYLQIKHNIGAQFSVSHFEILRIMVTLVVATIK